MLQLKKVCEKNKKMLAIWKNIVYYPVFDS